MPREGENLLRFVRAIARQDGWSFGTPWPPDGGRSLVVPILRTGSAKRRYVLAEEVAGEVRGKDLGQIDRIRVRNDSNSRVLVRSGALFRGLGTNSRGVAVGAVIEPNSAADVQVRCVDAGHPISAGAGLELIPAIAPDDVHEGLLRGDQGLVWHAVRSAFPRDGSIVDVDLADSLADGTVSGSDMDEILSAVRGTEGQCGAFLFDEDGVAALELFDDPKSWRAASSSFLARHAEILRPTTRSPLKTIADPDATTRLAKEFLESLSQGGFDRNGEASWKSRHALAEITAISDEVIHLSSIRPAVLQSMGMAVARTVPTDFPATEEDDGLDVSQPTSLPDQGADVHNGGSSSQALPMSLSDDSNPTPLAEAPRKRKVLTSGWDHHTFQALEHYSHKEFEGDRSAALRFLARAGLRQRGYFSSFRDGPTSSIATAAPPNERMEAEPDPELIEAKIHDLERIAQNAGYAKWLRKRARLELERMASSTEAESGETARIALDRIPALEAHEETPEQPEPEPVAPAAPAPVDVRGILRQALTASAGGDYALALSRLDEVLEIEPDNATALLGRAIALRRSGKATEALADLDLVLHLQPANAAALMNRGRILQERGDLAAALETFDRLRSIAPNDWDVWQARGDLLVKMGRDEEAVAAYAEALRRNPDDEKLKRRLESLERVPPVSPGAEPVRAVSIGGLEEGECYLVKERQPQLCYRALKALGAENVPAMIITYQAPNRVRRESGLTDAKILGLSHSTGRDVLSPTALPALAKVIERFVESNRARGAILLDGLEYLIANNGFREAILFVEHVNEFILQRRAIVLIPMAPDAISDKEFALLERNLRILT